MPGHEPRHGPGHAGACWGTGRSMGRGTSQCMPGHGAGHGPGAMLPRAFRGSMPLSSLNHTRPLSPTTMLPTAPMPMLPDSGKHGDTPGAPRHGVTCPRPSSCLGVFVVEVGRAGPAQVPCFRMLFAEACPLSSPNHARSLSPTTMLPTAPMPMLPNCRKHALPVPQRACFPTAGSMAPGTRKIVKMRAGVIPWPYNVQHKQTGRRRSRASHHVHPGKEVLP